MPLQVSRVAIALSDAALGIEPERLGDFAPRPAEAGRGARADQAGEFVGAEREAAVGIHLPHEAQREPARFGSSGSSSVAALPAFDGIAGGSVAAGCPARRNVGSSARLRHGASVHRPRLRYRARARAACAKSGRTIRSAASIGGFRRRFGDNSSINANRPALRRSLPAPFVSRVSAQPSRPRDAGAISATRPISAPLPTRCSAM